MRILRAPLRLLTRATKIALSPITKPTEKLVSTMIQNIIKKALSSLLKAGVAALIVGLGAFLTGFQSADLAGIPEVAKGPILLAVAAGVNALISALKRWTQYDPTKV